MKGSKSNQYPLSAANRLLAEVLVLSINAHYGKKVITIGGISYN